MSAVPLPLVLRKGDHVVTAVYNEKAATLMELEASRFTGDYRECEVCFSPADPTVFAHASTSHLRCCRVSSPTATTATEGSGTSPVVETKVLFEVAMPHVVVDMCFSPRGSYLVTYAQMDPKRTPDGNLSIFAVPSGQLLRRGMQGRWPAMRWTAEEEFVVRPVQGWLHVLDGRFEGQQPQEETEEKQKEESSGERSPTSATASPTAAGAPVTTSSAAISKIDLMLARDKDIDYATSPAEGFPILALFKPFYKNQQGTFFAYRLPHLKEGPLFQLSFGRAESGTILWSRHSGKYIALLVGSESDPSGKSYYGKTTLHLVDVMARGIVDVKLKGEGETVHDCQWCPTSDELMVIHGRMPHNKATLFSKGGVPLMTFGEAPRNFVHWAPNGSAFVLGGSGNLAGDYQFFAYGAAGGDAPAGNVKALPSAQSVAPNAVLPTCTGEFSEKCSFQSWAPDSHNFLCSTVFTRLRMDNKLRFVKNNGASVLLEKYELLYGAHWVALRPPADYPKRPASPRPTGEEAAPKPQVYKPPGGTSRAAAMLRRSDDAGSPQAKQTLPVGAGAVVQKKRKKGKR